MTFLPGPLSSLACLVSGPMDSQKAPPPVLGPLGPPCSACSCHQARAASKEGKPTSQGWAACLQHKVTMDVPDPLLGQGVVGRSAKLPCAGSSVGGSRVVCKVDQ